MFSLRTQTCELLQEGTSVTQYFNYLKKLWQELDLFNNQQWHDPTDAKIYKKTLAKERIYDFLAGLNPSLDDVRGRILSLKPLPDIDEIFADVWREENIKQVMLGPSSSLPTTDSSTMVAKHNDSHNTGRNSLCCDHCQRPQHTKATCWKLHGKPTDWVPHHLRNADWEECSNCYLSANLRAHH